MRRILAVLAVGASSCTLFTLSDLDGVRRGRDAGGVPHLVADRASLDFGSLPTGVAGPPAMVQLSNSGTGPAGTFTAELTGVGASQFSVLGTTGCEGLGAQATCLLSVTFTPAAAQTASATLTVTASPGGTVTLALSGTGVVPGALSITPDVVDFGSVVQAGQSATLGFTVKNTGSVTTGALSSDVTGTDALQFEITTDTCAGQPLLAGGSCTVSARFSPGLPGPRRATLAVTGAPGGTAVATLIGQGLAPGQLGISPSSRMLATIPAGTQGAPSTFQLTNSGAAPTGTVALALSGSGARDFELLNNGCTGVLMPTTSCTVQVRFAPGSAGPKVATLVATADPGGQASAALSATAQQPAELKATPPMFDYGTVLTSQPADATIRIENPGAVATGPLTPVVSGGDAPMFSVVSGCNVALMPAQNCDLVVRFAPTAAGTKTTSLVVSAVPGGAVTVPLRGDAVTPGALQVLPGQQSFGMMVAGGTTADTTFTVTNTGGAATSVLTAELTGSNADQFAFTSNNCTGMTLQSQASCDVALHFAPTSGGSKSASLRVSATTGGITAATLSGQGLAPAALSIGPLTADLGSQLAGQAGLTQQFDVSNTGGVATATPLTATLSGNDPSAFTIIGNGCGSAPLMGGGMCPVTVQFTPLLDGGVGAKSAQLDVQPVTGPGGVVHGGVSGTSLTPSALGFDSQSFGAALLDAGVTRTFTLTNSGGGATGPIVLSISGGTAPTDFSRLGPPSGTDCDGGALVGGASCTVRVLWNVGGRGTRSANLTADSTPGGPAVAQLSGTGQAPARLTSSVTNNSFSATENGITSSPYAWTVTNSGDITTGTPVVMVAGLNGSEFGASGCAIALDAGASCNVAVTFTPQRLGLRQGSVQVQATPGNSVALGVSGDGLARITIKRDGGSGIGTVTSSPAGINCGSVCSATFSTSQVTLTARTANDAGSYFRGWSGACAYAGVTRDCTLYPDLSIDAGTARFDPIINNLVFVSSTVEPPNRGGSAPYDAECNALATAAGINPGGNSYVAWMSTSTSTAKSRVTTDGGFILVDGRPFADRIGSLTTARKIYNPISLDEWGVDHADYVLSATEWDGTAGIFHCGNWTKNTPDAGFEFGSTKHGPEQWTHFNGAACDDPTPMRIFCFMRTRGDALVVVPNAGKLIWTTGTGYVPGSMTPDAKCNSERPAAVALNTAKALVGRSTAPAASVLNAAATYVRPDGQVVGTYAELVSGTGVRTGVWQDHLGVYAVTSAWTGFGDPDRFFTPPTPNLSCNDWTDAGVTAQGAGGWSPAANNEWFAAFDQTACNTPLVDTAHLICVQP